MTDRRKIKLVQAITGAIVLTLLMQLMGVFGYFQYTWMCFLPLLMFFAFGANNMLLGVILPTVLVIFCILTVHENLFEGAIFSNVPCIFMGMATSFFMTEMGANPDPLQLVRNFCFWCFGIFLAVALVLSGMAVCSAIFGKERAMAALMPLPPEDGEQH